MQLLAVVGRWELITFVAALGAIVLWKLFQSGSFAGLLRAGDGSFSAGRAQLLTLTILVALQYLLATIHDPSCLPLIPANLVAVLGGSQAVYLGAKAWNIFGWNRNDSEDK